LHLRDVTRLGEASTTKIEHPALLAKLTGISFICEVTALSACNGGFALRVSNPLLGQQFYINSFRKLWQTGTSIKQKKTKKEQ